MMSTSTWKLCLGITLWGGLLWGSLLVAKLPGDGGHGICGPWGCGPTMQALASAHLAWLVALSLPALFLMRGTGPVRLRVGFLVTTLAVTAVVIVVAHERLAWWPQVDQWRRSFFWQRCGFCIVTAVDIPVLQTLFLGLILLLYPGRRQRLAQEARTASDFAWFLSAVVKNSEPTS